MNTLRRIFVAFSGVAFLALAILCGLSTLRGNSAENFAAFISDLFLNDSYVWALLLLCLLFLGLAILMLIASVRATKRNEGGVAVNEEGTIVISIDALNTIVKRAALSISGVKDAKTEIELTPEGLALSLNLILPQGTQVVAAAERAATAAREQITLMTGLTVIDAKVLISAVTEKEIR